MGQIPVRLRRLALALPLQRRKPGQRKIMSSEQSQLHGPHLTRVNMRSELTSCKFLTAGAASGVDDAAVSPFKEAISGPLLTDPPNTGVDSSDRG